jgi:hypothetical protein
VTRRLISRWRKREEEKAKDRRFHLFFRRRLLFDHLFKWINSRRVTVIYPERKDNNGTQK